MNNLVVLLLILLLFSAAVILIFFLHRRRSSGESCPVAAPLPKRSDVIVTDYCGKVRNLVEGQMLFLNPDITFESVRQEIGTNRTYLSKSINEGFGMTFKAYIATLRVQYARKLIDENPHVRIMDMFRECGFRTQASLDVWFKATYGKTPQEYALEVQARAISQEDPSRSEEQEP